MANSSIPGPLEHNVQLAGAHGSLGCDVGCRRGHTPGPIQVADADAPTDKSRKPAKASPAPTKVDTIILHIYSPITQPDAKSRAKPFSQQDFIDWFKAPDDPRTPDTGGKWFDEGIDLEFFTDTKTGVEDIKKSLQRKGAIVVYIGHSALTPPKVKNGPLGPSLGLTPQAKEQPEIPNATLRTLLNKSTASLVIIASCDSKTAVGNLNAGPPIIVTNSGNDRKSWIFQMADAVATFLFLLIGWELGTQRQPNQPHKGGNATIAEALKASAGDFVGLEDRFELVNGDGSIKLFP